MNELDVKRNSYKYQMTDFTNKKIYYYDNVNNSDLYNLQKEKKAQIKITNKKPFVNKYQYKEVWL
jgi:hypothetical protein